MKFVPFEGGRIFTQYSRTDGWEAWVWFKNPPEELVVPYPEDGIDVLACTGASTYEEALEAAEETIEAFCS